MTLVTALLHPAAVRPSTLLLLGVLLSFAGSEALAGPGFRYGVRDRVMKGEAKPALILVPNTTVKRVRVTLVRDDGKKIVLKSKRIGAGREKQLEFRQGVGKHHYRATLTAQDAGGQETTMQIEFDVEVAEPIEVVVDKRLDHVRNHYVTFTCNRDVERVELEVANTGAAVRNESHGYPPAPAGTLVKASWEPLDGDVLAIRMKVYDTSGFWAMVEMLPYSVQHTIDGLVFETGKWNILPTERSKLDSVLGQIRKDMEAVKRARAQVDLRLYVAGYTDTVGGHADNVVLSRRRAKAIAGYFSSQGLGIPMYYQGFGEKVLAVETDDNVAHPGNRRAIFVLANAAPGLSANMPRADWKRLK